MIPIIGIPIYNRVDLLLRLIDSIDYPVGKLVVVNNGEIADLGEQLLAARFGSNPRMKIDIEVFQPGMNLGVAGAWNYLLHKHCDEAVMLVNNDIEFAAGDLEKMDLARLSDPLMCAVFGNWSFSNFLVTKCGKDVLGYFDENLWPAYLEDGDYWRRIVVSSAKVCHAAGVASVHGESRAGEAVATGSCTINADEKLAALNGQTHAAGWDYYRKKWGFQNEQERETFVRPFNDVGFDIQDWTLRDARRMQPHYFKNSIDAEEGISAVL